jgi:hypothetical protein
MMKNINANEKPHPLGGWLSPCGSAGAIFRLPSKPPPAYAMHHGLDEVLPRVVVGEQALPLEPWFKLGY